MTGIVFRLFAALVMGSLLIACSSTPSSNHYLLTSRIARVPGGSSPALGVGPVTIPEYLNRDAMVYRQTANQLQVRRDRQALLDAGFIEQVGFFDQFTDPVLVERIGRQEISGDRQGLLGVSGKDQAQHLVLVAQSGIQCGYLEHQFVSGKIRAVGGALRVIPVMPGAQRQHSRARVAPPPCSR